MIFPLKLKTHETICTIRVRNYVSIILCCQNSPCSSVSGSYAHTLVPLPLRRTPWLPTVALPRTSRRQPVTVAHHRQALAGVLDKNVRKEVAAGNAMYPVAELAAQAAAGAIPAAAGMNRVKATRWLLSLAVTRTH